jgi:hypothetical protein
MRRYKILGICGFLVSCGGGNVAEEEPKSNELYTPPSTTEIGKNPGGFNNDLVGVRGAINAGYKGQGVSVAICETGPCILAEMNARFPGKWRLGASHQMPIRDDIRGGTDKTNDMHALVVSSCVHEVAPEAQLQLFNEDSDAFSYIVENRSASVINRSMYIPQLDGTASYRNNIYPDKDNCTHIMQLRHVHGKNNVIVFISAGNDAGCAACNRILDTRGNLTPLTAFSDRWNVFFVGQVRRKSDSDPWELSLCYPAEGSNDQRFFVCDDKSTIKVKISGTEQQFTMTGTSFSSPQVAGVAAIIISRWPDFGNHCNDLGKLMYETADLIPVTYTPERKADGSVITSRVAVTQMLRRPNVQRALAMDRAGGAIHGVACERSGVCVSEALGESAFDAMHLERALWVDKYGRNWSGLTDAEADLRRSVRNRPGPTLLSILEESMGGDWSRSTERSLGHWGWVQASGQRLSLQERRTFQEEGPEIQRSTVQGGVFSFHPTARMRTSLAVCHKPGAESLCFSSGLSSFWRHCQQNGLLSLFPHGTILRNSFALSTHQQIQCEIFFLKGPSISFPSGPTFTSNKTRGGFLSFSGRKGSHQYRLRAGFLQESAGVLASQTAGILTLGPGSQTGFIDLTLVQAMTSRVQVVGLLVYGTTHLRQAETPSLFTPLGPLQTVESRLGVKVAASEATTVQWGIF